MRTAALLSLAALTLPALAGAQELDAATRQGIDAHAFQFSGRHCGSGVEAKPGSEATPGQFRVGVVLLDEVLKETAAKDRTLRYTSSYNDRDLYRATLIGPKGSAFLMMFLSGGKSYVYKCKLK